MQTRFSIIHCNHEADCGYATAFIIEKEKVFTAEEPCRECNKILFT